MNSKKTENTNLNKTENTKANKIMTIIGVILCVILIPILAVNITLIIKSQTNKDEVPKIGGYCPLIVLTGSMEPEISDGDLIIVKQIDGKDVQVKDVIAFFDPESTSNSILTHRVIEVIDEDGKLSFEYFYEKEEEYFISVFIGDDKINAVSRNSYLTVCGFCEVFG